MAIRSSVAPVHPSRGLPVSAPPRVAARLRAAGDGPREVVHRGPDAVYVDLDGWCLGVVSRRATQVPCALRTRLDSLPPVRAAHVDDGVLLLDGVPLVVGRLVGTEVPPLPRALTSATAPDADLLVGSGPGLTPYGDDVLCGWLAVHRAAGVATPALDDAVRRLLARTTLLSATLLDCAMRGEVLPELAAWLRLLDTPGEPAAEAALHGVGGSSGAGLLEGARWALAA